MEVLWFGMELSQAEQGHISQAWHGSLRNIPQAMPAV